MEIKTVKSFAEAEEMAENYFRETYGYYCGVGVESANGTLVEFYSIDDPAMDDTFKVHVNDGRYYECKNGGTLTIKTPY